MCIVTCRHDTRVSRALDQYLPILVQGFLFQLERLPEPLECGVDCNHSLGGTAPPVRVEQECHLAVAPVDPLFDPSLGIVWVVLTSRTQSQPSLDGGPQAR